MPTVNVDKATFNALTLAQAAIKYARNALPYGSANQRADLLKQRNGGPSGAQALERLQYNRTAVGKMMTMPHGVLPAEFGATDAERFATYGSALSAGVSLYYGAGNCGEHAYLTYHFLTTFGFPGLSVLYASSSSMDHAYTVLSWPGCQDWVVCDAWPTKPQACLWSHFFANTAPPPSPPAFNRRMMHTITDRNMGTDLIGDAYKLLAASFVNRLQPGSGATSYTTQQVLDWLNTRPNGVYNHESVLATRFLPSMDYQYGGQLLSTMLLPGEQWTARLAGVIVEVNNQLHVLDPAKRYTASQRVA